MRSKVPLQGAELDAFLAQQRAARERQAAHAAALARKQRLLEADADADADSGGSDTDAGSDADSDGDGDGGAGAAASRVGDDDDGARSFDIFLKGNGARGAGSFFRSAARESRGFRTFPYVEKRRRVDTYGEVLDVERWMRRGKIMEEEQEQGEGEGASGVEEEEAKNAPEEAPSKFVAAVVDVQLACRLLYIDLEGLNDGRATKAIIPQVNPRKMVRRYSSLLGTAHSHMTAHRSSCTRPQAVPTHSSRRARTSAR
jgi:cleavage and polyadenylation specificity factor subunit 2